MAPVEPGTYRIVNVASGTCIMAYKDWDAVCWRRHEAMDQHWYVQRSGAGYRIKNRMNGLYLVVSETTDTNPPAKVFCGRYPTTWELNQGIKDYEMYIIKQAGCDRVVDLDGFGDARDGNEEMEIRAPKVSTPEFYHQNSDSYDSNSDETGEENEEILKKLQAKSKEVEEKDSELVWLRKQLASQAEELALVKLDIARGSAVLAQTQETLRQVSGSLAALVDQSALDKFQSVMKHLEQEQALQKEKSEKLEKQLEELGQKVEFCCE
ncbi:hypothetical protein FRC09_009884 [Ceratobasidium sp. 395]|nr:hypothetical protein FRC09_009884 [Ceratobasidium sp. 395]